MLFLTPILSVCARQNWLGKWISNEFAAWLGRQIVNGGRMIHTCMKQKNSFHLFASVRFYNSHSELKDVSNTLGTQFGFRSFFAAEIFINRLCEQL